MVLGDRVDGVPRCVHGLPRTTCVFCSRSYWPAMLIWAGVLIIWWVTRGPGHPVVALILTTWTWLLGPGVAGPVIRRLPRHWFRVPAGERILHRMLGVGIFGWLFQTLSLQTRLAGMLMRTGSWRNRGAAEQGDGADEAGASDGASPLNSVLGGPVGEPRQLNAW